MMLSHESQETCRAIQRGLQLSVPIIPVQQTLYDQYRVRVAPFTFFIDAHGVVHWKGLANTIEQWEDVWRLAQRDDIVGVEATRSGR
ncbi:MAG TPA: hypothetical protein VFN02_04090 [Ktedonobacteraceae bacterium]|nr:hypothetical protein [Ktedonobacteraceae bacterium]